MATSSDPSGCGCMYRDGVKIVSCGKPGHFWNWVRGLFS